MAKTLQDWKSQLCNSRKHKTCGYGTNHTGDSQRPVMGCSFISLLDNTFVCSVPPMIAGDSPPETHKTSHPSSSAHVSSKFCKLFQALISPNFRGHPAKATHIQATRASCAECHWQRKWVAETHADSVNLVIMDKVGLIKNNELCESWLCLP